MYVPSVMSIALHVERVRAWSDGPYTVPGAGRSLGTLGPGWLWAPAREPAPVGAAS